MTSGTTGKTIELFSIERLGIDMTIETIVDKLFDGRIALLGCVKSLQGG